MKKGVKMMDMSIHDVSGVVGWCLGAYSIVENTYEGAAVYGSLAVVENSAETDSVPKNPEGVCPARISARPAPSGRPISHLETTELPPCQLLTPSGALTLASLREREQCKLHSCYFPNGRLQ